MIKIIFNEKKIFLVDTFEKIAEQINLSSAFISFNFDKEKIQYLIDDLLISENEYLILVGNPSEVLEKIKSTLRVIKAGGGVVLNSKNEILFIYRRKKWDFPKGKLEDIDELIEECAIREVIEETGIKNVYIQNFLLNTYHIYIENEMILKETNWFEMFSDDKRLTPQKSEGIKKAIWVHQNNIRFQLENSYESIVDIIDFMSIQKNNGFLN